MSEMGQFECSLYPCPLCEQAMILVDGKNTTPMTFWARDTKAYATPHAEGCELQGEMIPEGLDLIGLLHEKKMRQR